MRIFICLGFILTGSLGKVLGQDPKVMDAVEFLTHDVGELKILGATFTEAVEQLRKSASSTALTAPEVKVVSYASPQASEDFPFREDYKMEVSATLSNVSVHQSLELLCSACGYALDMKHGELSCFEVPHVLPNPRVYLSKDGADSFRFNVRKVVIPAFQADKMPLLEAFDKLCRSAEKASGKKVPPIAVVGYHLRSSDPVSLFKGQLGETISLNLKEVSFEECLRYISELGGCTYRVSPDGWISVREVPTLYHPRFWRVVSLENFARVMKTKPEELTESNVSGWMKHMLEADIVCKIKIHRASGRVYLSGLNPEELSSLEFFLPRASN